MGMMKLPHSEQKSLSTVQDLKGAAQKSLRIGHHY
jgi:hypothetical protein